jgi:hypothetical protein
MYIGAGLNCSKDMMSDSAIRDLFDQLELLRVRVEQLTVDHPKAP